MYCEELLAANYWVEIITFVMRRRVVGKSATARGRRGDMGGGDSVRMCNVCTFVLVNGVGGGLCVCVN